MKTLREYVREQLDDNNNVLITEGKFWDWLKSLFTTKAGKKSKKEFDDWLNSSNDAKKFNDDRKKLNDEFKNKSETILNNIDKSEKSEDIEKFEKELSELISKKSNVYDKIKNDHTETIKKAPSGAMAAVAIEAAADNIKWLQQWKKIFISGCVMWDKMDVDEKQKQEQKKKNLESIIKYASENIKNFSDSYYADEIDETKNAIVDTFKNGKIDKYLNITDNEISLNDKEYNNLLVQEYKNKKEENEKS